MSSPLKGRHVLSKVSICLVKDAVWHAAQFIVLSHTSDNWRLLKYPLCCCSRSSFLVTMFKPGCMARLMLIFPAFFIYFFVRCKFRRAGFDDLWGVILLFDVQSSLIQTSSGMQGQNLLWCARAASAKSWESRGHCSFTKDQELQ